MHLHVLACAAYTKPFFRAGTTYNCGFTAVDLGLTASGTPTDGLTHVYGARIFSIGNPNQVQVLGLVILLVFDFCDNSMREKDWRCRKRGTQVT